MGGSQNTSSLNLSDVGVKTDRDGFIIVDEYQKSSAENVFAIGDVCGNPMLAHKATHEGKVAAEVACGHPAVMDSIGIPSVVYTNPK